MTWKRGFAISFLVLAVGSARLGVFAQDTPPETQPETPESEAPATPPPPPPPAVPEAPATPPPEAEPPATEPPAPPATEESSKPGFWGDHFALYIEGGGGTGSVETIDSSIETSSSRQSLSQMDVTDAVNARVAVGWRLPLDRGSFRVVFTGHSEDNYEFNGVGLNRAISGSTIQPAANQPWWNVSVNNGTLTSVMTPPTWVDADGDDFPDQEEIQSIPGSGPPPGVTAVPDNAQNRLQTWDFLFVRDFGGKTWSGDYSCGIRHLVYDGNVPASAWLTTSDTTNPAGGFTDGKNLRLLSFNQETTGTGPTGSLGLQWHLFRNRLTFFAGARFAFLLQDMKTDSGNFFTLVTVTSTDPDTTRTVPARLAQSVSKSTWNFGGGFGARFNVVEGFHVELAFDRTAYQDTVLLPFSITIPSSAEQAPFGTVALYQTQDLDVDSVRLALGFQF